MRDGSILRQYASAIAGPDAVTRARSWTSSVRCAVISASTPSGCWEANLASHHDVLDGLHNTTNRRCSRYCAGYGLQPIRCAASDWWLPCRCGCHTMRRALARWMSRLRSRLTGISPASIDRLLKPIRVQHPKGLSGTKPGTLLKNQIPIRATHWDITLPGFMEADTVAHCGNSLAGDFVWSLTLTDILTGWTECRATWNKGSSGVLEQIKADGASVAFQVTWIRL